MYLMETVGPVSVPSPIVSCKLLIFISVYNTFKRIANVCNPLAYISFSRNAFFFFLPCILKSGIQNFLCYCPIIIPEQFSELDVF